MNKDHNTPWTWLTAAVIAHLGISMVHGSAHGRAGIPMSTGQTLFIFIVILAGPPIGLALTWFHEKAGALMVGITMAASLVFGVVNHFAVPGPDHVAHVDAHVRMVFMLTAILLTLTEGIGAAAAVQFLRTRPGPSFHRFSTP